MKKLKKYVYDILADKWSELPEGWVETNGYLTNEKLGLRCVVNGPCGRWVPYRKSRFGWRPIRGTKRAPQFKYLERCIARAEAYRN